MGESEAGEVAVSEASESGDRARGGEREVKCSEVTELKLTRVATSVRERA